MSSRDVPDVERLPPTDESPVRLLVHGEEVDIEYLAGEGGGLAIALSHRPLDEPTQDALTAWCAEQWPKDFRLVVDFGLRSQTADNPFATAVAVPGTSE
jgi:hypothetical protein